MNSLLKKITLSLLLIFLLTPLFQPTLAADADPYGLNTTADKAGLPTGSQAPPLTIMVGQVIGWGLGLLGMVFLLLIICGGILWMTAAGSEEKVKKAKMIIGTAIGGLIVVFLAYSIANLIIKALTNASVTTP